MSRLDASALRRQSEQLLADASPEPAAPSRPTGGGALLAGEEHLTADDLDLIACEPEYKREVLRRGLVETRTKEHAARARTQAAANFDQRAERAARKVLHAALGKDGRIDRILRGLMRRLGDYTRERNAAVDARFGALEQRITELEGRTHGR